RLVLTVCECGAFLWDTADGRQTASFTLHRNVVLFGAFDRAGKRVVTTSADRTARLWDAATGLPLAPPLPHRSTVFHAAFSPDGNRVVTAGHDGDVCVWDSRTGHLLTPALPHTVEVRRAYPGAARATILLAQPVHWAAFSPDGRHVVTVSED